MKSNIKSGVKSMNPVDHQIADSVWKYVHSEVYHQVRFLVRHQINVRIWDRVSLHAQLSDFGIEQ